MQHMCCCNPGWLLAELSEEGELAMEQDSLLAVRPKREHSPSDPADEPSSKKQRVSLCALASMTMECKSSQHNCLGIACCLPACTALDTYVSFTLC